MAIAFEYFCQGCGQLRLSLDPSQNVCGNCGNSQIIKGEPGKLDKESLKKQFSEKEK